MNDTLGWRERLNDLISYYDDDDNDDIWNRLRDEKKRFDKVESIYILMRLKWIMEIYEFLLSITKQQKFPMTQKKGWGL